MVNLQLSVLYSVNFIELVIFLLTLIAYILIFLIIYFLPLIVAVLRNNKQSEEIAALNLFLGWTLIGWVAAFIWAIVKR